MKKRQKNISKHGKILLSMTPVVKSGENDYYVHQIKYFTRRGDRENNNIALEGGYGVGKSSVIKQLLSDKWYVFYNKPKIISFLSFLSINDSGGQIHDDDQDKISKKIQSEIVRQLFYSERPNKLRGSGYKRLGKIYYLPSLICAIILSTIVTPMLKIDLSFLQDGILELIDISLFVMNVLLFFSVFEILFRGLFNGNIKNISAKNITFELADEMPDFEQLIDLLIFYFKRTRRRVIIFEDLDRFNDASIFEALRQLNFIINQSRKLRSKVKFIYAVRADLFISKTDGSISPSAVQAKLFDVIIPIAPFMSFYNLENKFREEWDKIVDTQLEFHEITKILYKHTSDMRVIKYMINQCFIFIKTMHPKNKEEINNCIAVAMIRTFYPDVYNKMLTSNSPLDKLRLSLRVYIGKKYSAIEDSYSKSGLINLHKDEIFQEILTSRNIPQERITKVTIDKEDIDYKDDGFMQKMYNMKKELSVLYNYNTYIFSRQEVMDAISSVLRRNEERDNQMFANELNTLSCIDSFSLLNDKNYYKESNEIMHNNNRSGDERCADVSSRPDKIKQDYPLLYDLIIGGRIR